MKIKNWLAEYNIALIGLTTCEYEKGGHHEVTSLLFIEPLRKSNIKE
jgi:hypothetical protein